MATAHSSRGILAEDAREERERIVEMLKRAYWMEIETVMSYLANSINPDGVRAQEIIASLRTDIQEELGHATQFANRIKELYGIVPGSMDFQAEQSYLQPPEHQTDIVHVIEGVIEAETGAIDFYNEIIEATEESDPVTNDMVIAILHDEEGHRRLFEGFLREYQDQRAGRSVSSALRTGFALARPGHDRHVPSVLSLTFDDGPDGTSTSHVLAALCRCGAGRRSSCSASAFSPRPGSPAWCATPATTSSCTATATSATPSSVSESSSATPKGLDALAASTCDPPCGAPVGSRARRRATV